MKKITLCIVSVIALISFTPRQSMASTTPAPVGTELVQTEKTRSILARLEEIKSMDKTNMTASEKKALRKEVRASKKQMQSSDGIYLSLGAIIIIILLLILLL
jgi:hypothetical protein